MSDPNLTTLTFRARRSLSEAIRRYKSYRETRRTEVEYGLYDPTRCQDDLKRIIFEHYHRIPWNERPDFNWWEQRIVQANTSNIKVLSEEECHDLRDQDPNFRKAQHYVRNVDHVKKNIEEDPWRREKRFVDRRGKFRNGFCCQPKTKKPYCKENTRDHRAWQKQVMHNEDYDLFVGDTHYINPYLWS